MLKSITFALILSCFCWHKGHNGVAGQLSLTKCMVAFHLQLNQYREIIWEGLKWTYQIFRRKKQLCTWSTWRHLIHSFFSSYCNKVIGKELTTHLLHITVPHSETSATNVHLRLKTVINISIWISRICSFVASLWSDLLSNIKHSDVILYISALNEFICFLLTGK